MSGKCGIYDGINDPEIFIQEYKICVIMKGWTAAVAKDNFPVFLKGKASRVYANIETKDTIQQLYDGLLLGCKPPNESLLVNFLSRKMKPEESISVYALELQQLLHVAMPLLQADYQSSFLRAHLCLSLPVELQNLVNFTADNLSWDQLLVKLDQMDAKRRGTARPSFTPQNYGSTHNALNTMIKNEPVDTFYAESRNKSTPTYINNQRNNSSQQRSSNQYGSSSSQGQSSGNRDRNRPTCHYCKIPGHIQADCRKLKFKTENNTSANSHTSSNRGRPPGDWNKAKLNFAESNNTTHEHQEFPFSLENNVLDVVSLNSNEVKVHTPPIRSLIKCNVELTLFGRRSIVKALIDGGSSHSFISPKVLSDQQVLDVTNKASRQNFSISGATGAVNCQCSVTKAELKMGSWMGTHTFIIANPVRKHEMIIGRDFLKANEVMINHGNDTLLFDGNEIHVNTVSSISNTWLSAELTTDFSICDVNVTVCQFTSGDPLCDVNTMSSSPVVNTDNVVKVFEDTIVKGNTQRLVRAYGMQNSDPATNKRVVMFEPSKPMPMDCLIGRSAHNIDEPIYCNVMNAGPDDLTFKTGQNIGQLSEIENANSQFDKDVASFQPLDIDMVRKTAMDTKVKLDSEMNEMITNNKLTDLQTRMLLVVLSMNESVFQWDKSSLGRTKLVEHYVNTGDNRPVQQKQYPIPTVAYDEIRKQTAQMLKDKIIRPSSSPWRSPVLLVKKKDSGGNVVGYRFCIDLTKVNAVTVKDSYPLPLISKTVDRLSGSKFFSSGDLDRAFWQIGLAEEDKEKFAFVMDSKLYEPNVMPFGSMNAPSTFQRLVDRVLNGLTWKQCLVYLDDILIFSKTFEEHLCHIHECLSRFKFAGLMLKPSKCNFAKAEVNYLGFKITEEGIRASDKKLEAMANQIPPPITKNLFNFLCSITYYRQCVPRYGDLTYLLYKMCEEKKRLCVWTSEALKCFSILKQAFITAPILAFPDFTKPFFIHTDASDIGISAVLLQMFELLRPISFSGRKLTWTEGRYSAAEREMLGVVEGYDTNYHIVYGRHIEFYTDHKPLVTMQKLKRPSGRLGRLFHRLAGVDYNLNYIPGSQNYLADFLSRSFDPDTKEADVTYLALQSTVDWQTEQSLDPEVTAIIKCIANNARDADWTIVPFGARWLREKRQLYLEQNASGCTLKYGNNRVVVPRQLKVDILEHHHDSPFTGHRGFESTILSINKRYYWNYMPSEVKAYCKTCQKCQTYNFACIHNRAPLKSIVTTRPWQMLGLDFMGPFKTTTRGNAYIILGVDHFTKFIEGAATESFDSETTALFVLNNIICRYGMVEQILSDQGVNFEAKLFAHLCALLGTDKLHTSAYHAAGNGITERPNKTVKPNLAKFVNAEHNDWDLYLQMAISAYNNTVHSTTGLTPFTAMFGRPSVLVADVLLNNKLDAGTKLKDVSYFIKALRINADYVCELIKEHTGVAQKRQKNNYDRFVKDRAFYKVGDTVKIDNFKVRPGFSKAFEEKFHGPYVISDLCGDLNYRLTAPDRKTIVVHYNRMSHFNVREGNARHSCDNAPKPSPIAQLATRSSERLKAIKPANYYSSSDSDYEDTPEPIDVVMDREPLVAQQLAEQVAQPADLQEEHLPVLSISPEPATEAQSSPEFTTPESTRSPVHAKTPKKDSKLSPGLTRKGKVKSQCLRCGYYFEQKFGMRIHLSSCTGQRVLVPEGGM